VGHMDFNEKWETEKEKSQIERDSPAVQGKIFS